MLDEAGSLRSLRRLAQAQQSPCAGGLNEAAGALQVKPAGSVPLGVSRSQALVCSSSLVVLAHRGAPSCSAQPPFSALSWAGKGVCVTARPVLMWCVIHRKQKQVRTKASFQGAYFPNFLHKDTAQILQAAQAIRSRRRKWG